MPQSPGKYLVLRILLCLIIASIPGWLSAQEKGTLRGIVYDVSTNETVPLANVVKAGTTIGTSTNEEGVYELDLESGKHQIRFSSLSYLDTLVTVDIQKGITIELNIGLKQDLLLMDEIVVSADRVTRKVQELAVMRSRINSGLESYIADIYKVAVLGTEEPDLNEQDTTFSPLAFSERYATVRYILEPERYSETVVANRSSKNFFSEYDFFSTGGPPLNLNQELIALSILSEDITVVGPVSKRAGRFYYLSDAPADSTWPEGTIRIKVEPLMDNRPLFRGYIWYDEASSTILGIDVSLNEYAHTNSGLFSISDLNYKQTYKKTGEFWLPDKTSLSAKLDFATAARPVYYRDSWSWTNFRINPSFLNPNDLELNTSVILPDAHRRKSGYWDNLANSNTNDNLRYLEDAKEYTEKNRTLRMGMSMMSTFFRLPYQLERFYLTNISDIYKYNWVQGHYLGLGLRTPIHSDYDYRAIAGYGFGNSSLSYKFKAQHYFPGTAFAPDLTYQKRTLLQYQDYEYNRTPLDFYDFRQTLTALFLGNAVNNYFERSGLEAGIKFRFDVESFFRVLYLDETHKSLESSTSYSVIGKIDPELYPNNDPVYAAQGGTLKGISLHFHHDTRKYLRTQFLRDYNIRDFGWLFDAKLEKGISKWGSDFDYNRYRIGATFNIPVFSSHFIQSELIFGASDAGTPNQRLFNYNGFVLDDYVRVRPFNTVSFKEPIGNRVSVLRLKYKFGSSLTRKIPVEFISKSGVHLAAFITTGYVDSNASLEPLLPYSGAEPQAEIGIAAFRIFGFMYVEFSQRLIGEYGNNLGLIVLF